MPGLFEHALLRMRCCVLSSHGVTVAHSALHTVPCLEQQLVLRLSNADDRVGVHHFYPRASACPSCACAVGIWSLALLPDGT
jgi:hypothetical protein